MLDKVNKYIKTQLKKLASKDREEIINFAAFLRKQKKED